MVVEVCIAQARAGHHLDFVASSTITHYVHGTQGRLGRTLGVTKFRFALAPSVPVSAHKRPVVLSTWLGMVVGMCGADLFGTLLIEASDVTANAHLLQGGKPFGQIADVQSDLEAGAFFGFAFRCSERKQ